MRTLVDLPKEDIALLNKLAKAGSVSRASLRLRSYAFQAMNAATSGIVNGHDGQAWRKALARPEPM